MKYNNMLEEELKIKVGKDFFGKYDCSKILSKIDFAVCAKENDEQYFLWAEAKAVKSDVIDMLAQLVLTIGKAKTFNEILPPPFLGCFDIERIVFIPYNEIQDIFYMNDFNWNVTSSDRSTKEFALVREKIIAIIGDGNKNKERSQATAQSRTQQAASLQFDFEKDEQELRLFIKTNFVVGNIAINKIRIDKNNFIIIYNKWLEAVKPTIMVNWDNAKKHGIIAGDFYLADLLSRNNESLKDILYVYLKETLYLFNRHEDKELGTFNSSTAQFSDGQKAHRLFWEKYERPPLEEYWDYILQRRDLLVPQDIRERKGSFYTPQKWVELSQKYLADVFGENWQDEYYIWDCAAGTGNLLTGLTNKYNVWASTIDKADIDVIHDRIKNGANLLDNHVFQFDFLNDDFSTLPQGLQKIINDENKRRKLIIYINPPYAEAGAGIGKGKENKADVSTGNRTYTKYATKLGKARNELYSQFLMRIYAEIAGCKIANFSTLKVLNAPNYIDFRSVFRPKLERLFIVPADTFDNVKGQFPIGFHIWDTAQKEQFEKITADVFNGKSEFIGKKTFYVCDNKVRVIGKWLAEFKDSTGFAIGMLNSGRNDFQNQNVVNIQVTISTASHALTLTITVANIIPACVFFAVRKVIPADWLNDRDQFLYPNDVWLTDSEFQSDCLTYTLFHSSNNISTKQGVNHWIPFTEYEVNAQGEFDSHFMTDFMAGKCSVGTAFMPSETLFNTNWEGAFAPTPPCDINAVPTITFSAVAQSVFDKGRELWRYYHSQKDCNVNASFYDIREYFQGRSAGGRMNSKSDDEMYNKLLGELRLAMRLLGEKIKPKIYEYGFLL